MQPGAACRLFWTCQAAFATCAGTGTACRLLAGRGIPHPHLPPCLHAMAPHVLGGQGWSVLVVVIGWAKGWRWTGGRPIIESVSSGGNVVYRHATPVDGTLRAARHAHAPLPHLRPPIRAYSLRHLAARSGSLLINFPLRVALRQAFSAHALACAGDALMNAAQHALLSYNQTRRRCRQHYRACAPLSHRQISTGTAISARACAQGCRRRGTRVCRDVARAYRMRAVNGAGNQQASSGR